MTDTKSEKAHPLHRQMTRLSSCITDLDAAVKRKSKDEIADLAIEGDRAWQIMVRRQMALNGTKGLTATENELVCSVHESWNAVRAQGNLITGMSTRNV